MSCGASRQQIRARRRSATSCWVCNPDSLSPQELAERYAAFGHNVDRVLAQCTCGSARRSDSIQDRSTPCLVKEHREIQRADAGPKKEPPCAHKFDPWDLRCRYCRKSELEVYEEVYGRPSAQRSRPPEGYGVSFARQKIENRRSAERVDKHRKRTELFLLAAMIVAALYTLLSEILTF